MSNARSNPGRTRTPRGGLGGTVGAVAVACAAALGCGGAPAGEPDVEAAADGSPFHILVTNDDGIESPGIQALAAALREVGEVTVVAPCGQQSGTSMSIGLNDVIRLRPFPEDGADADAADAGAAADAGGLTGHCVNATPAGAVLLAVRALAPEAGFDMVVSGINRGANIGEVSHMSGTVGAAMMGAYLRLPAVAASQGGGPGGFEFAAGVAARFVAELRRRGAEAGLVYSINFPAATAEDTRSIAARPMGGSYFGIDYEETPAPEGDDAAEGGGAAEGARWFRPVFGPPDPIPAGSDTEAHNEGLVTITPLRFDWTDHAAIDALGGWNLDALLAGLPEGG